jgi:hypothetical protein
MRLRTIFAVFAVWLCSHVALAQEAYVYVSTVGGTYVYDAASTGKLTLVKGSPFKVPGSTVGTNGKYWVTYTPTANTSALNSFQILSNGAIGKLVSSVNSQLYSGSQCGAISSGELSHSGQNVYAELSTIEGDCDGFQTYALSSTGKLTFSGDTEVSEGDEFWSYLPTLSGNGKFGYSLQFVGYDESSCDPSLNLFQAESQNVLQFASAGAYGAPAPPPGYFDWQLLPALTDDPTDHIVLALRGEATIDCGDGEPENPYGPAQLASFTPNSQGALSTTNTYKNMPAVAGINWPTSMRVSPSGKFLAVAVDTGVQFFHFNGANPITKFTGIVGTSGSVTGMAWDTQNHLYALNTSGKMHVYAVTATSVKELSGSRSVVPIGPFIVRSK